MSTKPLFTRLNLTDQHTLLIMNAPESFAQELVALGDRDIVQQAAGVTKITFALIFVQRLAEIAAGAKLLARAKGDPVIWFAYPKGTSRRYRCEFNRDTGWEALGKAGFEGVRQIAIDEDWSALRFRRVEHIKRLTRAPSRAISRVGKSRTIKRAPPGRALPG
jgi:hypothetical protein